MKKKSFTLKNVLVLTVCIVGISNTQLYSQLAKCKGKYMGNIIAGSPNINYNNYWNQATSENGSKWGTVEATQGSFNWSSSDVAYNWAKNNGGLFKYHNFAWGSQTPGWVANASVATITNEVKNYITACSTHYTPMGGLKMIDVVNEPVNTALSANYKAALTAGYQAEPANAADKNNTYGWVIWVYQLARKAFPNATLLINEYNVEHNWNNCRQPYIDIVNAVKNAPNLTDGSKNLIDGVGLQCHGVDGLTASAFQACIDEIWTKTGVPIHLTEFDAAASPNEAAQQTIFSTLVPVAWAHPHVAGITFWGYVQGTTWINGNGTAGANGTDSGIMYASGTERPALTWLKSYMASQTSLSCCPAPAPFAACTNGASPTVSITAPANNATFAVNANITITATAADADGTVSKVDFYSGTTLLSSDATSPYSYTWNSVAEGSYSITAVATDNSGNMTTSTVVNIVVGNPVTELVNNGEFDNGTTSWTLQNNSTGNGTMSVVTTASLSGSNALKICPTSPGTADWHVQLQQPVSIVSGKSYQLSFLAKADAARTITIGVQENSSPYTLYFSQSVNLTTASQSLTYTFTADTTDPSASLKFFVGNNSTCIYLDKVSLKQGLVVTGVDNYQTAVSQANVFPNPFNDHLTIESQGAFLFQISDFSGKLIETGNGEGQATVGKFLAKGIFLVKVTRASGSQVFKLVKE